MQSLNLTSLEQTLDPLEISPNLQQLSQLLTKDKRTQKEKAEILFQYIMGQTTYHNQEHTLSAQEVNNYGFGKCGELTYLYISLARASNLKSGYVKVKIDHDGRNFELEDTGHACAYVFTDQQIVLVDPAYKEFDIKHQAYEIINDDEVKTDFTHFKTHPPRPKKEHIPDIDKTKRKLVKALVLGAGLTATYKYLETFYIPQRIYKKLKRTFKRLF